MSEWLSDFSQSKHVHQPFTEKILLALQKPAVGEGLLKKKKIFLILYIEVQAINNVVTVSIEGTQPYIDMYPFSPEKHNFLKLGTVLLRYNLCTKKYRNVYDHFLGASTHTLCNHHFSKGNISITPESYLVFFPSQFYSRGKHCSYFLELRQKWKCTVGREGDDFNLLNIKWKIRNKITFHYIEQCGC